MAFCARCTHDPLEKSNMRRVLCAALLGWLLGLGTAATLAAQEYRLEPLAEPPPADELTAPIAAAISSQGYRVMRGEGRRICDIWFCNTWELPAEPAASEQVVYPFAPGQLVGVIRFSRRGSDFRGQQIAAGVYTLRYGLQPVDGNHVGTADSRDFLLLVPAARDTSTEPLGEEQLFELSKEAARTTHPASLFLARPPSEGNVPRLEHEASREWWLLVVENRAQQGDATRELRLSLVVVGQASE